MRRSGGSPAIPCGSIGPGTLESGACPATRRSPVKVVCITRIVAGDGGYLAVMEGDRLITGGVDPRASAYQTT